MFGRAVNGTRSLVPQEEVIPWAKAYITVAGVLGILTGLLGFTENPFVGDPANGSIFATDALHDTIHIVTGLLALWIGLATTGMRQAIGIVGFGLLYVVLFGVMLASPTLSGLLDAGVNNADHVLHAALAVATLVVGFAAFTRTTGQRKHSKEDAADGP